MKDIKLHENTHKRLAKLKAEVMGKEIKTFDDVINWLIDHLEENI